MQKLKIERKFGESFVTVEITDEAVGVSTPLDAYMGLLLEEMDQVATIMTKAQLNKKMLEAAERLNLKMKAQVKPYASLVRR